MTQRRRRKQSDHITVTSECSQCRLGPTNSTDFHSGDHTESSLMALNCRTPSSYKNEKQKQKTHLSVGDSTGLVSHRDARQTSTGAELAQRHYSTVSVWLTQGLETLYTVLTRAEGRCVWMDGDRRSRQENGTPCSECQRLTPSTPLPHWCRALPRTKRWLSVVQSPYWQKPQCCSTKPTISHAGSAVHISNTDSVILCFHLHFCPCRVHSNSPINYWRGSIMGSVL